MIQKGLFMVLLKTHRMQEIVLKKELFMWEDLYLMHFSRSETSNG